MSVPPGDYYDPWFTTISPPISGNFAAPHASAQASVDAKYTFEITPLTVAHGGQQIIDYDPYENDIYNIGMSARGVKLDATTFVTCAVTSYNNGAPTTRGMYARLYTYTPGTPGSMEITDHAYGFRDTNYYGGLDDTYEGIQGVVTLGADYVLALAQASSPPVGVTYTTPAYTIEVFQRVGSVLNHVSTLHGVVEIPSMDWASLVVLSDTEVAVVYEGDSELRIKRFSFSAGTLTPLTDHIVVNNGADHGNAVASGGDIFLVASTPALFTLSVFRWSGSTWSTVATTNVVTEAQVHSETSMTGSVYPVYSLYGHTGDTHKVVDGQVVGLALVDSYGHDAAHSHCAWAVPWDGSTLGAPQRTWSPGMSRSSTYSGTIGPWGKGIFALMQEDDNADEGAVIGDYFERVALWQADVYDREGVTGPFIDRDEVGGYEITSFSGSFPIGQVPEGGFGQTTVAGGSVFELDDETALILAPVYWHEPGYYTDYVNHWLRVSRTVPLGPPPPPRDGTWTADNFTVTRIKAWEGRRSYR